MVGNDSLKIRDLHAGYAGRTVLDGIDLGVKRGERVALIGPNGCGKSTLFKVVMGLIPQDSGSMHFRCVDLQRVPPEKRVTMGIGYLPQTANVFPLLSVEENLEVARLGARKSRGIASVERIAEDFPVLSGKLATRAGLLSGGERQALALGMLLVRPVDLLLLDEPIAGLSPKAGAQVMASLSGLQSRDGFAVVIVEHRLTQIQPHVDRFIVMRNGELAADMEDTLRMVDADWLDQLYMPNGNTGKGLES